MPYDEEKPEYEKKFKISNKSRKLKIVIAAIVIVSIVGAIGSLAYSAGFIPITGLLDVKEPAGDYVELNTEEYLEEYPEINEIPNLDKIKYQAYGTDESVESVESYYEEKLRKEGYGLIREGRVSLSGKTFQYYGFLKGLTAVGVLLVSGAEEEVGYDTMVVYTTGSAFDYKEILEWYQNQA